MAVHEKFIVDGNSCNIPHWTIHKGLLTGNWPNGSITFHCPINQQQPVLILKVWQLFLYLMKKEFAFTPSLIHLILTWQFTLPVMEILYHNSGIWEAVWFVPHSTCSSECLLYIMSQSENLQCQKLQMALHYSHCYYERHF